MKCHYCHTYPAKTKDHIVPKCMLKNEQPRWFKSLNLVDSCFDCNNKKGNSRSDCKCDQCHWAWKVALAFFLKVAAHEKVHSM